MGISMCAGALSPPGARADGDTRGRSDLVIGVPQDKSSAARSLVPEVALAMPTVHSLVIYNPPTWVGLPMRLAVDQLVELDLQVTHQQAQTVHAAE